MDHPRHKLITTSYTRGNRVSKTRFPRFASVDDWHGSPWKLSLWDSVSNRAFSNLPSLFSHSHSHSHPLTLTQTKALSLSQPHLHFPTYIFISHTKFLLTKLSHFLSISHTTSHIHTRAHTHTQPRQHRRAEPNPAQRRCRRGWAQPSTPLLLEPNDDADSSFSLSLITTPIPIPILLGKLFIWFFVLIIVKFWVWIWILNI